MLIGWREIVAFPEWGIPGLKAKIDSGAKTSALHVFEPEVFERDGKRFVRFQIHPLQNSDLVSLPCEAELVERRKVTNSGGQSQRRYVVRTVIELAGRHWPIELTLTNRDKMKYRMLLGRSAMSGELLVDPQLSYQCGKKNVRELYLTHAEIDA
ncbi:MAG: ATP-dependent zinc protease [Proteobacteria bacterium]|nr:ATP-dependent zinc protease [Pseudomonadota bacterium]